VGAIRFAHDAEESGFFEDDDPYDPNERDSRASIRTRMALAAAIPVGLLVGGIFLLASRPAMRIRRSMDLVEMRPAETSKRIATASPELKSKLWDCLPNQVMRAELTLYTSEREDVIDLDAPSLLGAGARVCFREKLVGQPLPGHSLGEWTLVLQR
jgi:hypothetical protein